jgi:hypothetical protein
VREAQAAWKTEADVVEAKVVKMSNDLLEIYPMATKALVNLFTLVTRVDQEVREINSRAPRGVRHLRGVELEARNLTEFHPADIRVTEKCILPPLIFSPNF